MPQPAHAAAFQLEEATIASVHAAFSSGVLSCEQLVQAYLDRIAAYDRAGPALRAVLSLNPHALEQARDLDARYRRDPASAGPLHGVPLVLKDNIDAIGMPTSCGNVALQHQQPRQDAFTVARLRAAGALVLAKTNLQELARGGLTVSSLGGQTLNPYDLSRTPGGSSGGTGAALAANFALAGQGTDTGQSIRSPCSANSLVGVRPTRGLVSRAGVVPNSFTQDETGPMARTVRDAALLLDAMAGYDPGDPITALGVGRRPASYADGLQAHALQGARIGLLTTLLGSAPRHQQVSACLLEVAQRMRALGATVLAFEMPELAELTARVATDSHEACAAFARHGAALPADAPVRSLAQLVATNTALPSIQAVLAQELDQQHAMDSEDYRIRLLNRERLRIALAARMADLQISAVLYPLQSILVVPIGQDAQAERNGVLSNGTGFPAVSFPAGFSAATPSAPLGVPIGAELLGLDYTEARLLAYAHAFEQAGPVRKPPLSTPPLGR